MTATTIHPWNASVQAGSPVRRGRRRARWVALAVFALTLAGTGCKSKGSSGGLASSDPLMGNSRIPPTSVPIPDSNGGLGNRNNGRTDPLLGSPTGNPKDKTDKTGASRKDDPDRWKGPFIPSQATTNAALTAKLRTDHSDLNLDDGDRPVNPERGARLQPAGGSFPVAPAGDSSRDLVPKVLEDDLASYGVKRGDYELVKTQTGEFAVRAQVPNKSGGVTRYEELGPTAAAAIQRLLDQLRSDQR